jgi:hypothetical protein
MEGMTFVSKFKSIDEVKMRTKKFSLKLITLVKLIMSFDG